MKIALIGATGFVGAAVLAEALQRGHGVTALARDPERWRDKLPAHAALRVVQADATRTEQVATAISGHDAVVSAFNPGWHVSDVYGDFLRGHRAIVEAAANTPGARLLVVGGAGSLFVAPGVQLVDTPEFATQVPPFVLPGSRAARDALRELQSHPTLDWTFLSPPALLAPGERTGRYRRGTDFLLMDGDRPAGISVADLAVALVDEIETPQHRRSRFTVASA
jgi:putative NADH-flavin reductase